MSIVDATPTNVPMSIFQTLLAWLSRLSRIIVSFLFLVVKKEEERRINSSKKDKEEFVFEEVLSYFP